MSDTAKSEGKTTIDNKIIISKVRYEMMVWLLQVQISGVWATQKIFSIKENGVKALVDELFVHNQTMEYRLKEAPIVDSVQVV